MAVYTVYLPIYSIPVSMYFIRYAQLGIRHTQRWCSHKLNVRYIREMCSVQCTDILPTYPHKYIIYCSYLLRARKRCVQKQERVEPDARYFGNRYNTVYGTSLLPENIYIILINE